METEVRVWYDQAALDLGWICEDRDIQATFTQHDSRFWEEEVVEFYVTTTARSIGTSSCNGIHWAAPSMPSSRTRSDQMANRSNSKEIAPFTPQRAYDPRRKGSWVRSALQRPRRADGRSRCASPLPISKPARQDAETSGGATFIGSAAIAMPNWNNSAGRRSSGQVFISRPGLAICGFNYDSRCERCAQSSCWLPVCAVAGRQPPGLVRLYVLDGGTLHVTDPSRFLLEEGRSRRTEPVRRMLSGPTHPRGALLWDTCAIPDSEWTYADPGKSTTWCCPTSKSVTSPW